MYAILYLIYVLIIEGEYDLKGDKSSSFPPLNNLKPMKTL